MHKTKEVLRQIGVYASSTFAAQFITLVTAVVSRRILGPVQTGIWATLQVVVEYSKYSTLGVMEAVGREIPFYLGKGDDVRAHEIKNLAFSFILTTSLVIAFLITFFALGSRHIYRSEVVMGLFLVAAIIILQRVNNLLICILRAFKKFSVESSQMVWSAIVNALLIMALTYRFQIYGFIFAMGLSFVFNIVYLMKKHSFEFHWQLNWGKLRPLMAFGLPLMSLGLLVTGIRSLDRIFLAKCLGFEAVGFYSIALMACGYINNFSIAIGTVLFPHGQEKFGVAERHSDMAGFLKKSSVGYALAMPAVIGAAAVLTPFAVSAFLPKFMGSLDAMRFLVLSSFFMALFQPYYDLLIMIRRYWILFPFLGSSLLVSFALYYGALKTGFGITAFAAVNCIVFFMMFSVLFFIAGRHVWNFKKALALYVRLLSCFFYGASFVFVLARFFSEPDWTRASLLVQGGLYLAFIAPLMFVLDRQYSLFAMIVSKFKK
jgi:O-antigen/teichoic acid export membrane protein